MEIKKVVKFVTRSHLRISKGERWLVELCKWQQRDMRCAVNECHLMLSVSPFAATMTRFTILMLRIVPFTFLLFFTETEVLFHSWNFEQLKTYKEPIKIQRSKYFFLTLSLTKRKTVTVATFFSLWFLEGSGHLLHPSHSFASSLNKKNSFSGHNTDAFFMWKWN